jgi:hypothetical protein
MDIVERLRDRSDHYLAQHAMDTMDLAAAEIERLRAALEKICDYKTNNCLEGNPARWPATIASQALGRALEQKAKPDAV